MSNYSNVPSQARYEYQNMLAAYQADGKEASEAVQAVLYAQAVEKQLLKSPASAVFPSADQVSVSGSNGVYTVNSYVDSQNSYGAMVRTPFTIHVTKSGSSWTTNDKFVST